MVTKSGHLEPSSDPRIVVLESAHPVPDVRSEKAASALGAFLARLSPDDLLFFLVTGGASALLTAPAPGITLADKQAVTRLLLACGADIHAINTVRRHLSHLKGGGVIRTTHGARIVTLAVSDVIGDQPESIGSGMTVPDSTTFGDALRVAKQFALERDAPSAVMDHLRRGADGEVEDTLKPGDRRFEASEFHIIASSSDALRGAMEEARKHFNHVESVSMPLQGSVEHCAEEIESVINRLQLCGSEQWALIAGGEPEVLMTGDGLGGRNQHLALLLAKAMRDQRGVRGLVAGTDGTDGPTEAAGAFFDSTTAARGREVHLKLSDHLARFDSYAFFSATSDLFVTGPTGTNVMDLLVVTGGEHVS